MNNKRLWMIFALIFILNISFVLADPFTDLFSALEGFDLVGLYNSFPNVIESLVYLIIFVSMGLAIAKSKENLNNRQWKIVFGTLGVALAIGAKLGATAVGFTFATLGTYVMIALAIAIGYGFYYLISSIIGRNSFPVAAIGGILGFYIADAISGGGLITFIRESKLGWLLALIPILAIIIIIYLITTISSITWPSGSGTSPMSAVGRGVGAVRDWFRERGTGTTHGDVLAKLNELDSHLTNLTGIITGFVAGPIPAAHYTSGVNLISTITNHVQEIINHSEFSSISKADATRFANQIRTLSVQINNLSGIPVA